MIVEYIRYKIPSEDSAAFETAYAQACESLASSEHCLAYELTCCEDDPSSYILRIEWDSAAGHLKGFRSSEAFRSFFAAIKPYVDRIDEMRHYQQTAVKSAKFQ